jgi:hypothetical protein
MNYKELHLEAIMIPTNVEELLKEEVMWDMEFPPFSISVVETVYKGKDTVTWSIEFSPAFDFDEVNELLEEKGHDPDSYGWTDYLMQYIVTNYPKAADRINEDGDADSVVFYTFSKADFTGMLKIISEAIRELYN